MNIKKCFFFIALACIQSLYPVIVEHNSFSSVFDYVAIHKGKKTLIICDIDNTIVTTPTTLGSDQWFSGMYRHRMKQYNISAQEAIDTILPHYFAIQHETDLIPVEDNTVSCIKVLQKEVYVIALTARSLPLLNRTIEQLHVIDIDFSENTPFGHDSFDGYVDHPYHYHQGIIFCGHNNKGKVLFDILSQCEYRPDIIIMIDDKQIYLEGMQEQVNLHEGIEFIGIRYGYLDHKVAAFDPLVGEQLLEEYLDQKK